MKRIVNITLALLLLTPLSSGAQGSNEKANPNYRNVFWLHGIQGDVNSLKAMSDYFRATYQINSYHPSYVSNRGFVEAAFQLSGGSSIGIANNDIAIAHSMGGLVSRQYYKDYPNRRFGGLITLNSPHLGAEFASSFDNGKIKNLFDRVKDEGIAGYKVMGSAVGNINTFHYNTLKAAERFGQAKGAIQEYNNTLFTVCTIGGVLLSVPGALIANWMVNYFSAKKIKEEIVPFVKDFAASGIELASLYVFGPNEGPVYEHSKNDLKPTSSAINSLKAATMNCPRITIAGTADYPAGIRFLGSTLSYMEQPNPGIGDISDNLAYDVTKAIAKDSRACESEYWRQYKNGSWWSLGLTNSYYLERRDAFKRQALFWENGFEREYQKCLGSIYYTTETRTVTEYVWVSNGGINDPIQLPLMPIIDEPQPYNPIDPGTGSDGYWQLVT
ncbi:MAG: hypothetical protein RBT19_03615, partial [Tenuifilaceae bacterium]|nr:hypothetical protein [Tenuifilaceae bacterium]